MSGARGHEKGDRLAELPFLAGEQGRGPLLVLLFFVSATVITVWGTWEGTLPYSEEAVLAETAREILVTGDGWTMHFDSEPVYDTPPLGMWCTAFFLKIFGLSEFAARLPFVLFSVLAFYAVFLAGAVRSDDDRSSCSWITRGRACGLLSAIILASSPLFGKFTPHVTVHIPFALFITLSLLGWLYLPGNRKGLALWGVGISGALLSGGAAGFLVIPASALSITFDRKRRGMWRNPVFIITTVAALIVGGSWIIKTAFSSPGGFRAGIGGLVPLSSVTSPVISVFVAIKDVWLRNLPWSIPATGAVLRILFVRRSIAKKEGVTAIDGTLLIFSAILFIPLALIESNGIEVFLPLMPVCAILAAREIGRWMYQRTPEPGPAAQEMESTAAAREPEGVKIWSLNQALISLFFLLMLLLVATPLRLHRTSIDPIKEIALAANELVPEGTKLGNYRQEYRYQVARLLFYGNRSLEMPISEPGEVVDRFARNPGIIFLSTAMDMNDVIKAGNYPMGLRVQYRASELVLFGLEKNTVDTNAEVRDN